MKHICPLIFLLFTFKFVEAQQVLPNGVSFFGQAAYNRPFNVKGAYDSYLVPSDYNEIKFKNSFSTSVGLTRIKKRFSFSPMLRYTYTAGVLKTSSYYYYQSSVSSSNFYLGKLSTELTWYGRTGKNKNLALGAGFFAGICIYKNVSGTRISKNQLSNQTYYYKIDNNSLGNFHKGIILDIKYTAPKYATNTSCSSLGIRMLSSNGIFSYSKSMIQGFREFELYATYNLWKSRTTHKKDSSLVNKSIKPPVLPYGTSFFGQVYLSRPVDNPNKSGYGGKALFKTGAGLSLGANFVNSKIIFSPSLKYGYVRGYTESRNSYHLNSTELASEFSILRLSEEFVLLRTTGRNKRFFLGGGVFLAQSIKGRYDGYYKTTSVSGNIMSTRKVIEQDFFNWNLGLIIDARYNIKTRIPSGSCFSIGARFTTGTSILPYSKGTYALLEQQGFDLYLSYNFWKKRKPEEPKLVEESKEPVNWNHQHDK